MTKMNFLLFFVFLSSALFTIQAEAGCIVTLTARKVLAVQAQEIVAGEKPGVEEAEEDLSLTGTSLKNAVIGVTQEIRFHRMHAVKGTTMARAGLNVITIENVPDARSAI
eukprot:GFUD01083476.1.p1 GENE.GFUD01083476.1~~GFUD01083476.1.p1  ORF type:complete len:110 (+),score=32.07 GFUD01083476.1:2-331(+)